MAPMESGKVQEPSTTRTLAVFRMINYPDTYSGTLNWLNYAGVWGNKGQTDCWWYSVYPSCKVVTGPIGPARDDVLGMAKRSIGSMLQQESMRFFDDLQQTLATISDGISLYSIRLGPLATNKADEIKTVIVKQYCADSQDTPVSHTLGYSRMRPATRHYVFEVPEMSSICPVKEIMNRPAVCSESRGNFGHFQKHREIILPREYKL